MGFHTIGDTHFETTDCLLCQHISNKMTEELRKISRNVIPLALVVCSYDSYSKKPTEIYVMPDHGEDVSEDVKRVELAISERLPNDTNIGSLLHDYSADIVVKPGEFQKVKQDCTALFMCGSAFERCYY